VAADGKSAYCKTCKTTWHLELTSTAEIQPGPIIHQEVPAILLALTRWAYQVVGHYVESTLEQWELFLMRDAYMEKEVLIWHRIALAFITYHRRRALPVRSNEEEKKLLGLLVVIASEPTTPESLKVTPEEHEFLLECQQTPDHWKEEAYRIARLLVRGGTSWSPPEHLKDWPE
jgi:hypothetical protein